MRGNDRAISPKVGNESRRVERSAPELSTEVPRKQLAGKPTLPARIF